MAEHIGQAWPLGLRHGAIQLANDALYLSVMIHEASHCITEAISHYTKLNLREPGHGPLWAGIYAYNLNYLLKIKFDFFEMMYYDGVEILDKSDIELIHKTYVKKIPKKLIKETR